MGEAKIRAAQAGMPTPDEIKTLEALSARMATELFAAGLTVNGQHQMVRMLALLTAGRVLARLGMTAEGAAEGMRQAVTVAHRQEIVQEGRRLAMAGEGR